MYVNPMTSPITYVNPKLRSNMSFAFSFVALWIANDIFRVLPYLPFDMTFPVMIPSMSSSAMISETRRCVSGLKWMSPQMFL
mgnify:CR=1 FL=1